MLSGRLFLLFPSHLSNNSLLRDKQFSLSGVDVVAVGDVDGASATTIGCDGLTRLFAVRKFGFIDFDPRNKKALFSSVRYLHSVWKHSRPCSSLKNRFVCVTSSLRKKVELLHNLKKHKTKQRIVSLLFSREIYQWGKKSGFSFARVGGCARWTAACSIHIQFGGPFGGWKVPAVFEQTSLNLLWNEVIFDALLPRTHDGQSL